MINSINYMPTIETVNNYGKKYHQQYYDKRSGTPYCHFYKKIF